MTREQDLTRKQGAQQKQDTQRKKDTKRKPKSINVRQMSLAVLQEVDERGEFSNHTINRYAKELADARDRGLLRELVYGVLTNQTYLDHMIDQASTTKTRKMDSSILQILRLGVYQIAFLDVPDHASIHESVELTKLVAGAKGKRLTGFVNGVLRNIQQNLKQYKIVDEGSQWKDLSVRYSQPLWLVEYLQTSFDEKTLKKIIQKNNETAFPSVRIDPRKITVDEAIASLKEDYIIVKGKSDIAKSSILTMGGPITESELFRKGWATIQSQSSAKVVEVLDPQPGDLVLDLCAAPGSKTVYMAQLMGDEGRIVANDLHESKLALIEENQKRMDTTIVETVATDASVLQPEWVNRFDSVLVDAPCSGFGLIRRKPEIRWNRTMEDVEALAKLQREILECAIQYVKPGGVFVYSTCTYGHLENEDQAAWLDDQKGLVRLPIVGQEALRLTSVDEDTDGFYIVKYQKAVI